MLKIGPYRAENGALSIGIFWLPPRFFVTLYYQMIARVKAALDLRSSSDATRHSKNAFYSVLAAPSAQHSSGEPALHSPCTSLDMHSKGRSVPTLVATR